MSIYNGMAFIKLFTTYSCDVEIPINKFGDYEIDINNISINAINPYRLTFFAKNVGTHKGYDFNVTVISSDKPVTINMLQNSIEPNEVIRCCAFIDIPHIEANPSNVTIKVGYDNV
ncbi:MAG: hypothetical protein ACRDA5_01465 [Clostridium sp.]